LPGLKLQHLLQLGKRKNRARQACPFLGREPRQVSLASSSNKQGQEVHQGLTLQEQQGNRQEKIRQLDRDSLSRVNNKLALALDKTPAVILFLKDSKGQISKDWVWEA
jgi:hypothetical protein